MGQVVMLLMFSYFLTIVFTAVYVIVVACVFILHFIRTFCWTALLTGFPWRPLSGSYSNRCCSSWSWHSRGRSCRPVFTTKGELCF